jgi:two-component system, NarL family, nitrate/nitrite response regulator NarL
VYGVTTILIHPNALFSEGLSRILSGTPFELKQVARTPDCLPADLQDTERDLFFIVGGRDTSNAVKDVQALTRKFRSARIVVIGDRIETKGVVSALEAGARGYLSDNMSSEALVKALDLVMMDETVLPAQFARDLPKQLAQQVAEAGTPQPALEREDTRKVQQSPTLSSRETAILKRLVMGSSNKSIAYNLAITEATVKVHVKSILRKIRARNRTQAAIWAVTHLSDTPEVPEDRVAPSTNGTNGAHGVRASS